MSTHLTLEQRLTSVRNDDLKFMVLVAEDDDDLFPVVFSRHETAEQAWEQAMTENENELFGRKYTACDENSVPLINGHFCKKEEHYESMVAHKFA